MCTINENNMTYGSYDIWSPTDRIFSHCGPILALLPPLPSNNQENQNFAKMKIPKLMIICYTVPEIWHVTGAIVIFHFGLFFLFFPNFDFLGC